MLHENITEKILSCCFEVINELGAGFLESVYQKALLIVLQENGLSVEVEKRIPVNFRGKQIAIFDADILVEHAVIIELKCSKNLVPENSAQVINYLKALGIPVGLLVNFGNKNLEYKRLHNPDLATINT